MSCFGYIQRTDMSCFGYIQRTDMSCFGYIRRTDKSCFGYIQRTDKSCFEYIQRTDMSCFGYIQRTEMSCFGYIQRTDMCVSDTHRRTDMSCFGCIQKDSFDTAVEDPQLSVVENMVDLRARCRGAISSSEVEGGHSGLVAFPCLSWWWALGTKTPGFAVVKHDPLCGLHTKHCHSPPPPPPPLLHPYFSVAKQKLSLWTSQFSRFTFFVGGTRWIQTVCFLCVCLNGDVDDDIDVTVCCWGRLDWVK